MLKSLLNTSVSVAELSRMVDGEQRFLSREACKAIADKIFSFAEGGGGTSVGINTNWRANVRWGRNKIRSGGDLQETSITVTRSIRGAAGSATTNKLDDESLTDCVRRAEALMIFQSENPEQYPDTPPVELEHTHPDIWSDKTYGLTAEVLGAVSDESITPSEAKEFISAGYVAVRGVGHAVLNTSGLFRYFPYTTAEFSMTARNRKGTGSGWAGVDFNQWDRIDTKKLTEIAIDKCERSQNPFRVEPGRYTAILEPQAVSDMFSPILDRAMDRVMAEQGMGPFAAGGGNSKIGQQLLDNRVTISADPMDPDCGFVPFDWAGEPYKKVNWFENGILKELSYNRWYGLTQINEDSALSNSRAYRMSGGTTSIEEMISSSERAIYVTRFNGINLVDFPSMLMSGNTRDGLWLIERGKITRPIQNFRITESPLFFMNNIVQFGVPQRVYRPSAPAVVPALKVNDFSFTGMMDAV